MCVCVLIVVLLPSKPSVHDFFIIQQNEWSVCLNSLKNLYSCQENTDILCHSRVTATGLSLMTGSREFSPSLEHDLMLLNRQSILTMLLVKNKFRIKGFQPRLILNFLCFL